MPKSIRHLLRVLIIVAVVASLPALLSPTSRTNGPYRSALLGTTAGSVMAQTDCSFTKCHSGVCGSSAIASNCNPHSSPCHSTPC
jgi:hypothetical protein